MLGHTILRVFAEDPSIDVVGTVRSPASAVRLPADLRARLIAGIDVENTDSLTDVLATQRPDVVINCIGLVKQLRTADDPLAALPINAMFPHRLARLAALAGARVIHVSTDCVFSGSRGMYREGDVSDAYDLYGRSKYLGELDYPNAVTLRTSIIGHELGSSHGLLEWFLAQSGTVKGFTAAIFSGLPTVELAHVMREHVLPDSSLRGVYQVASTAIAKFDLLRLIGAQYQRSTTIVPDPSLVIDRSLDGSRFREATGYVAPPWPELVRRMHAFH